MGEPTFTGYWSVRSVDRLRPEHMDQVRDQLTEAMDRGDVLVVIEGLTFVWHELDRRTEERVRAEAVRDVLAALRGEVEGLDLDSLNPAINRAEVLDAIDRYTPEEKS